MFDPSKNSSAQPTKAQLPAQSTRRSFAKSIAITISAVLAGSLITLREWYRSRSAPAIVIAHTDEIPVGGTKIFQYPTDVACFLSPTGPSSPARLRDRYLASNLQSVATTSSPSASRQRNAPLIRCGLSFSVLLSGFP